MKPLLSGQDLKQATVRDYKRWAERAGQSVDANELEKQAVADLNLADAYDRNARSAGPVKPDPEKERARRESLEETAAENGTEIVTGKMIQREIASLSAKPIPGSKWSYAMGRLARILARPNLPSRKPWEDCEIPHLAKRIYELKAFVLFRHLEKVGSQMNPLYGLNAKDFERKFRAMTIQICDESTGRLGSWWTPK